MSVSPNRKRVTNGLEDSGAAPHFRSVSQLAYVEYGYAKAEATRTLHPKPEGTNCSPSPSDGPSFASSPARFSPTRTRPQVPFAGKSNAEFSYCNTTAPPVRPTMRPNGSPPKHVPFAATSESRSHFKNFGYCKSPAHVPKGQMIQPVPFQGEPESRRAYVDYKITSVPPIKHDVQRPLPHTAFNGNSTMRESFTGSPSPPRRMA